MIDSLRRLYDAVCEHRDKPPNASRTSKLLQEGRPKMAKKIGEEAFEVALEIIRDNRQGVILESADLLYNLTVLWADMGIQPDDIWAEMQRREDMLGIAEKLPKEKRKDGSA